MTTYLLAPKLLQRATNPSQPYTPVVSQPQSFAGGDRVILQSVESERTFYRITNTDTVGHTLTVPGGDPVLGAGQQRPITYFIPAQSVRLLGPLDSSISRQRDGSLLFQIEAGHTGDFEAFTLPKGLA